jgi:hypothetical protein
MEMTGQDDKTSSYNLLEVECPEREHTIQKTTFLDPQPGQPADYTSEEIVIGKARYLKSPSNGSWSSLSTVELRAAGCAGAPSPIQSDLFPAFKLIRALAHIEKGGMQTVSGESCREWNVTFHQPNGTEKSFGYCINPEDNLPRRIRSSENGVEATFSNWNKAIGIQPPAELGQ